MYTLIGEIAMAMKIPIASRKLFTDVMIAAWNAGTPLKMHLYKASHTPADIDTLSTYTAIEADFGGYAPQAISGWLDVGLDADDRELVQANPTLFVWTSGTNDIYGYFVTNSANNALWFAELRAGGPITVDVDNPLYFVLPRFTGTSEF